VRGFSSFDVSFVYVIFEDGTDPYWARTRVLEFARPGGAGSRCAPGHAGWCLMLALPSNSW
jgi:copper/silver efflux system protein